MKRTIKLAVVAALALGATSAFATNGATMIGYGAKSFGMGGTGIGVSHGAESALANPALITTVAGSEVSFGGTVFMPSVSNDMGYGETDSDSDMFMIPSVSLATKVNDNFYWGIGMWGTGGLGVDYRNDADKMYMVTALQLMQFGVPLVYTANNFAIGVTPIVQYGSLDIQYDDSMAFGIGSTGSGVAQDLQIGYSLGLAYNTNGLTLGAVYKSEIKMDYKDVLPTAMSPFMDLSDDMMPNGTASYTNSDLSSPAEYGIGVSYKTAGHTLAIDYKNIAWEDAEGYKDFDWQDQDVIAVGYEYATSGWAVRAGYQFASSAVEAQSTAGANSIGLAGGFSNMLNLLGFPGTAESHVTVGGTYAFNEKLSLDLAYVHTLEADDTMSNGMGDVRTKHSEDAYSFQVNFAF
ncbi:OmpP1/FadL family transporter [Sulfurimonas sp.]|uniref:OmpP1/FadL family transporter n=1 Tax=Sulfurimonas sp. TaxID=2022749 RepID=UPI00286DE7C8|nr:outer membrane protein transport protein [Sulfurimonas sp.]